MSNKQYALPQSEECQRADWRKHREYCSSDNLTSPEAQQIHSYSRYHHNNFIALALCFFSFASNFSRLQETDQRRWLVASQKQFLHITLIRVEKPFCGRHNKVAFKTARLNYVDNLPENVANNIRGRLEARFPSVCLGYSVEDPDATQQKVTTYTHKFPWLATGYDSLRIPNIVRSIWQNECILQIEAAAAQLKRKKSRTRAV